MLHVGRIKPDNLAIMEANHTDLMDKYNSCLKSLNKPTTQETQGMDCNLDSAASNQSILTGAMGPPTTQPAKANAQIVVQTEQLYLAVTTLDSNLDSAFICGDEYIDEAASTDFSEQVSSVEYTGDWEIFCLERSIQSDGQVSAAVQFPSLRHTELYIDPYSTFNSMTRDTNWEPPWPWNCYTMSGEEFPMKQSQLFFGSTMSQWSLTFLTPWDPPWLSRTSSSPLCFTDSSATMEFTSSVPWLVSNIADMNLSTAGNIVPSGETCIDFRRGLLLHFLPQGRIEPSWLGTSSSLPTMVDKRMMETNCVPHWPSSIFKLVTLIDKMTRETPAAMSPPYYEAASTIVLAPSGTSVLLCTSPQDSFSTRVARELCVVTPTQVLTKTLFLPKFVRHSAMYDLEPTELFTDLSSTYCLGTFTMVLAPLGTMTLHSSWTPRLLSTLELLQFSSPTELCMRTARVFSRKLSTTELCEAIPGLLCRNPRCSSKMVATGLSAKGPHATAETLPPKPPWALPRSTDTTRTLLLAMLKVMSLALAGAVVVWLHLL